MKGIIIVCAAIGLLYGLLTGIPLGMLIVASIMKKTNITSKGQRIFVPPTTTDIQVFDHVMEEEFSPLRSKTNKLSREERRYKENIEYFKRNMI